MNNTGNYSKKLISEMPHDKIQELNNENNDEEEPSVSVSMKDSNADS